MSKAHRRSLLCLIIALLVSRGFDQDAANPPTPETEPVIVTGSNIPTQNAAEVGPNPVQVIDRYTIEKSGERTTEQLLRDLPVANANGVPASGNGGNLSGQGAASIALRGLDPGATLVLIDGHRVAPHPSGTSFGLEAFVDLNTIPRAAIDNVEILKDGASTAYGADAIAGVVNIRLRRDYRGAEINVEYGNTTEKDSGELAASVVFGVGNENTNVTGVLNYYRRNSIFRRDRDYDRETPALRLTPDASPFNLEISRAVAEAAAGRRITEVDPSLNTFFAHAPFFSNGTAPAANYTFTPEREVTFPENLFTAEVPDTERYGALINADHKIFRDQLVAYGDLFLQRADVRYELPPGPTNDFFNPGFVTGVPPLAIPPHSPGVLLGGPSYADVGLPPDAYNPFNPFDQIFSGTSRGRLFEFGPRDVQTRTDVFFTTAGLRGDKLFDGSWGYDAALRYSQAEARNDISGIVSTSRFQRTLNAADPIFDPASPEFIGTTAPYNPFGDYRVPIANNTRFAQFVLVRPHALDRSSLTMFDLNIYSTDLWQLPAGPIGLAFGSQVQHETLDQAIDDLIASGDIIGLGAFAAVHGSRESYAGYAETSIPVFGPNFRAPGLHSLEFTAAARFEAFSNDTNVMVPKFGVRWQPFDDSLTVRATWGEGFKQPTLVELFAPAVSGPLDVFDPITDKAVPDLAVTFLPNPNLQPEDSRNFTAGVVYSPTFVPGLAATVDLFNIETIGWIDPNPDTTPIIARIETGNGLPGESLTRDANGNLTSLTYVSFANSGTQKVRGADFALVYEVPTSIGAFRSTTQATFLDSYQFSPRPGEKEIERRSSPSDEFSLDAYVKWKGTSRLAWIWHGFDAGVTAHYLDGFHEIDLNGNEHWVRQTWLFDLWGSYDFGTKSWASWPERFHSGWPKWRYLLDGTRITVGVNNIFDHDPPRSNDNFPRFIYDTTGRFIYASVTKTF